MAENQKKDGFFKKIGNSAKATKSEVKKVSWPSKKQLINNTGIVIVCILIVGLVIFALDTVFGFGFAKINDMKTAQPTEVPTADMSADGAVESSSDVNVVVDEFSTEVATDVVVEVETEVTEEASAN
ncbi:MAG: preprotein translocase subunit SecE [Clostridia bacterium]|nr:preprotein translocase subunit SecE [Clostridia bacterium]